MTTLSLKNSWIEMEMILKEYNILLNYASTKNSDYPYSNEGLKISWATSAQMSH